MTVCKPSSASKLQVFNPLEESELNLHLCMSHQNETEESNKRDSDASIMEAMTRKCVVKVRNLNQEEIDFLCGPKLLPSFTISIQDNKESSELEHEQLSINKDKSHSISVPESAKTADEGIYDRGVVPPLQWIILILEH